MPADWKSLRMRKSADFAKVRDQGKSCACREFAMGYLLGGGAEGAPRVGFISSRKVGGAVERNRARRRLRALVRNNLHRLRPDLSLVLIARPPVLDAPCRDLQKSWDRLAERAGIYHTP